MNKDSCQPSYFLLLISIEVEITEFNGKLLSFLTQVFFWQNNNEH